MPAHLPSRRPHCCIARSVGTAGVKARLPSCQALYCLQVHARLQVVFGNCSQNACCRPTHRLHNGAHMHYTPVLTCSKPCCPAAHVWEGLCVPEITKALVIRLHAKSACIEHSNRSARANCTALPTMQVPLHSKHSVMQCTEKSPCSRWTLTMTLGPTVFSNS